MGLFDFFKRNKPLTNEVITSRIKEMIQGCAASSLTIKMGVEKRLKEMIPQIQEVVDVTDHSAGESPYYAEMPVS